MKRGRWIITAMLMLTCLNAAAQTPDVTANPRLRQGMFAYISGDYKRAIPQLDAALEELKSTPGFEKTPLWRALVDSLGMAYGITGDLKTAKATFDYGVSKDPTYPMFHYNLACTFAEMNERDQAIAALKHAFTMKASRNPGEAMPNPAKDSSFARYLKDKAFIAALEEIRTTGRRSPDRLDFTATAAPWVVSMAAEDFEISESRQAQDGKVSYFLLSSAKTGLTASVFIEPADECKDSKSCRDLIRASNLPAMPGAQNVSSSEIGAVSVFEYFLPEFQGQPIRQHHLYAEFVQDGFWVDMHISKVLYERDDRKLFEALVKSVKFEKK
jgi:tetratricopeptide (TPR) repeat protein